MRVAFLAIGAAMTLAGCGSISVPVEVVANNGERLSGSTTASLSGGTFSVAGRWNDKALSCSGDYNALERSPTITIPTTCSDGRRGTVTAIRDPGGMSGMGYVQLNDGTRARFAFGHSAAARTRPSFAEIQARRQEALAPVVAKPSLPAPEWVVAQSEPYRLCGRDEAIRLAVSLPNERPADIATAASLRCSAHFQKYSQAIRDRVPFDLRARLEEATQQRFRDLVISVVLSTREKLRNGLGRSRPETPKVAPAQKGWAI